MSTSKQTTYINTAISGLVIPVEHNLEGTPGLTLTEIVAGKEVYVSLMDARIGEIKTLDKNHIQLTFASAFNGYLTMFLIEIDSPNYQERLIDLEGKYISQLALIEGKVGRDQWIQMNTLLSAQNEDLQNQIEDLQSQINLLKATVEAL